MPQVAGFFLGAFGVTAVPGVLAGGWAAGMTFASTAIGGLAVKLLASVALSALSTALAPKPKAAGIRSSQLLTGGTQPESFILGRYATNGTLAAPAMSHGSVGDTPNAYLTYVIEIGAGSHALAGLILDGEEVTIETTSPHASYGQRIGGRFNGFAWIKFYDGTQVVADPMLLAKYPIPAVRPWTADMVGRGISYAILTFRFGRRVFQGWPNVRFVADGPPLYDPRQDSTAGGSGAQRWDDPSTWTRTHNPKVMKYNMLRGITLAGMIWGGGVPAADLPYANWAAAMNACDVAVDDGDGGTEPQYRAGFEVIASDEPMAVIEELDKTCAGATVENGGVWRTRAGAPGLPVKFLTDDDILIDGPEDFRPFPSIEDIFNGIEVSYPDPESLWESRDADPLYNAIWEAEDGSFEWDDDLGELVNRPRRLVAQLDMPACPYPLQVQRVMAAIIADHRRMRRHTLSLPPDFSVVEPLDVISWTSEANGYSAKSFELGEVRREILTGNVLVTLREVDPEDYDPPVGLVRPAPPDTTPARPALQILPGWGVTASALVDAGSTARRPAITASWTAAGVEDARGIRIAIRLDGDSSDGRELPLQDAAAGSVILADGILPATNYQLRALPVLDRETDWTAWTPVTTLDVRASLADLEADIASHLTELETWIDGGFDLPADVLALATTQRTILEQIRTFAAELTDSASQQVIDVQASASAINTLTTLVAENNGAILALAESLTTLTASVGQSTAEGKLRISAEATPEGALARIGLKVAASSDEDKSIRSAALFLEARANDESTVIINTDKFAITHGQGDQTVAPFIVIDGVVYLNEVFIAGMASFGGTLESDDFVDGVSGWQITQDGDAQFNSLIDRSDLQNGAVSDVWQTVLETPIPGNTAQTLVLNIGAVARGSLLRRGVVFEAKKIGFNNVALQRRSRQLGASFTTWVDIVTWNQDDFSTDWDVYSSGGNLNGYYDEYEYRLAWSGNSTGGAAWIRNIYLTVADVKK